MPTTFQWQPYQSDAPRTVADLMLRSGDAQAAAIRANGAARANAVGNIGGAVALSLAQRMQEQKEAPIRALQQQVLQQQASEGGLRLDAAQTAAKRATLAQNVIAAAAKQFPDDVEKAGKMIAAAGLTPEAAAYVETNVKAADAWRALRSGQIADADKAHAFEADQLQRVMDRPAEQRQPFWTAIQGNLKAHGVDTSELSPTWDDDAAAQQIALYKPKPELMTVAPGASVIDKNNPTAPAVMTAPARPPTAPNVGSFEDYVVRRFGQTPTPVQITQARKDYNQADDKQTPVAETVPLTPAGLDAAAMMFANTGQLPPMGMGAAAAAQRAKIINRAAVLMPGLDLATAKADFTANQGSLKTLQAQRDAIGAFEQTALKNLDVFLDAAKKIPDTGSPLFNRPIRALNETVLGGAELTAYNTARRTVIPEFAKILANPGLSGQLSDSARHEVEEVVSGNATLKQTIAAAAVLKTDAANRRTSYDDQIKAIRARISKASASPTPDPAPASAPAGVPSYQDYLKAKGGQ